MAHFKVRSTGNPREVFLALVDNDGTERQLMCRGLRLDLTGGELGRLSMDVIVDPRLGKRDGESEDEGLLDLDVSLYPSALTRDAVIVLPKNTLFVPGDWGVATDQAASPEE